MSERTVQRYLRRENIHSRQVLEEIRIDWSNLNQIPTQYGAKRAGFDIQPYFLQDEQGKRYPPKLEIAKKLLKQKRSVWLMRRSINLYWYEHESIQQHQIEPQEHTASPNKFGSNRIIRCRRMKWLFQLNPCQFNLVHLASTSYRFQNIF
jgi:hypothetical protein